MLKRPEQIETEFQLAFLEFMSDAYSKKRSYYLLIDMHAAIKQWDDKIANTEDSLVLSHINYALPHLLVHKQLLIALFERMQNRAVCLTFH